MNPCFHQHHHIDRKYVLQVQIKSKTFTYDQEIKLSFHTSSFKTSTDKIPPSFRLSNYSKLNQVTVSNMSRNDKFVDGER